MSTKVLSETPGFNLTFELVSFSTKITAKVILNVAHHGWVGKNIFHSRLPKTALNRIFQSFCFTEKHQICMHQKNCVKNHLRVFFIKLHGILHTHRNGLRLLL